MKKIRLIALLLVLLMTMPLQVFALEGETVLPDSETPESVEISETDLDETIESEPAEPEPDQNDSDEAAELDDTDQLDEAEGLRAAETAEEESAQVEGEGDDPEVPEEPAEAEEEEPLDTSTWTAADFIYEEYSQRLYGCDYSRDLTVSGMAVAGFSETGLQKNEVNKDLVIPSKTDTGETVVGVAKDAFKGKGLTSVKFPSGMLIPYDDTVTHLVTKRGNFVIAENAFADNELTSVTLPDGVIAVMSYAFNNNNLTRVTLPKTIWWIETMSFANNQIEKVGFPETTWFQLEMHGMAFARNNIQSVRLPDFTVVVNKHTFMLNPGMEPLPEEAAGQMAAEAYENSGVVYMFADTADMRNYDRIHHIDQETASTKSWFQKLIINGENPDDPQNPDTESWNVNDFTFDGTTITGLSASGIEKRKTNKDLVLPDYTPDGDQVTAIADGPAAAGGLFATADEKFDSVTLSSGLKKVGANVFRDAGLSEVAFAPALEEIGVAAFQTNNLTTVILPDTVTTMGGGAFATNPKLEKIGLSSGLTEIPASAFACSDAKNWMTNLTEIEIPEGITKIGSRAFAGNNFSDIVIPEGVTEIGTYAFSTKNYLMLDDEPCTLTLPSTLTTIGNRAFRNLLIEEVELPATVTALPEKTFEKVLSSGGSPDNPGSTPQGMVTKVYVTNKDQYNDKTSFPASQFHKLILTDAHVWTPDDFTYGDQDLASSFTLMPATDPTDKLEGQIHVITGFTESGLAKLETNKNLVLPEADPDGNKVQGVGNSAFTRKGLTSVTFPEGIKTANDKWDSSVTERGDFFIGTSAFSYNELTELELPEGVIFVGGTAFRSNKLTNVKFPSTIMLVANTAFGSNAITTLDFPAATDFPLQVDNMAFAINQIESVQFPDKTEKVTKWAFLQNAGKEPVETGTAAEKKGGIVYMYINDPGSYIDCTNNGTSNVQKLFADEAIPSDESPWGEADFTFDDTGRIVTGLTDSGKAKIKKNPALVIPDRGPTGEYITEIGQGVLGSLGQDQIGTFGIKEEGTPYVPTSVKLPSKLQVIGNNAFSAYIDTATGEIRGLTSVTFPETLISIGNTAFQNAPLTSVTIPEGVTTIGSGSFTGTIYLSEIHLPSTLTAIPQAAFTKTNNAVPLTDMAIVKNLVIPEGVTSIGNTAFQGSRIETLTLPESLQTIGNNTFNNHNLSSLMIPASVTSIGTGAFAIVNETLTPQLSEVILEDGFNGQIKGSNSSAPFKGNTKLTEIEAPTSWNITTKTAYNAFYSASDKVRIRTSVQEEYDAYAAITTPERYTYEVVFDKLAGTGWTEEDFTYDGAAVTGFSETGAAKFETKKDVVLPDVNPDGDAITAIADAAFAVPEDQVDIGKYDANSDGMESVVLPKDLVTIGQRAFEYNMLQNIDLEGCEALKEIGSSAFHGNHLRKVHIPDTVDTMGEGTFAMNSITDLKLSGSVTVIPAGSFAMNIRMSKVEIPDTVTEIGETAFAGARLTELTIPESVTKIGRKAFHLHHLSSLTVPGNVKEIGESAFEGTYKEQTLEDLTLEEGIESIGKYAFKEGLLVSTALPMSLETMGEEPFLNNTGTGTDHTVILTTENSKHLKFNAAEYNKSNSHLIVCNKDVLALDANGGTLTEAYLELDENGIITADSLPEPTPASECESFAGWFTDREGGDAVTADTKFENGDVIYAHYDENHEWDEGVVTTPATFDEEGVMTYTCQKDPSHTKTEVIPKKSKEWNEEDFTYDETGKTVTGLTDAGKEKIKVNPALVIPDKGPTDEYIDSIGDGVLGTLGQNQIGTFGILEEGVPYVPTSVTLPSHLMTIGNNAFSSYINTATGETKGLTSVEFPDTLTSIGNTAFQNAPLTSIELPDSVTVLGTGAFTGTIYVSEIKLSRSLTKIPQGAFTKSNNAIPFADMAAVKTLVIPDGVTEIGNNAFTGSKIEELTMPDSITKIGNNAFTNHQLSEVKLPAECTSVGTSAFAINNESLQQTLTKLELNPKLTSIGNKSFGKSALRVVEVPETVATLHKDAFLDNNSGVDDGKVLIKVATEGQFAGTTKFIPNGSGHKVSVNVTFDANGGELTGPESVVTGLGLKVSELSEATIDDECNEFDGWSAEKDGGEKVTLDTEFTQDTVLYAQWKGTHSDVEHVAAAAKTCEADGNIEYWHCSICDRYYSDSACKNEITLEDTVLKAEGHKWDAGTVTRKATATAAGVKTFKCTVCGRTRTETIPKVAAPKGTVTILNTVANSAKKTNDVIWDKSKVTGATGYIIEWRARGAAKWASRKVGNVTRGVTSGLTIGNLYEIRVTPYKAATATTAEVTGTPSAIVYRYFFTTQKIRLASNSKGTFTMSWAKDPKATSYQVLYTTNSNGSGAAQNIKTAGASATSITVKDIKVNGKVQALKSGTTYYVQVREVRTVGGKNYIGNISVPVAVKVK